MESLISLRPQRSMFSDDDTKLGLDEYQEWTTRTDRNPRPGIDGLGFAMLGLFGEAGSLLSELKKETAGSGLIPRLP